MSKKKILILTNFSEDTNHARLAFEKSILESAGYSVDIFLGNKVERSFIINLLEKLLLKFINIEVLFHLIKQRNKYDIYFFYGVHALNTLLLFPSGFKRKCIYQTLNHDIEYQIYELQIRIKGFQYISGLIKIIGLRIEKSLVDSCGKIIVNSQSLKERFPEAILIYYSSPLEGINITPSPNKRFAFVYLGQLRKEKISNEFFVYIEQQSINFFLLGKIKDEYIAKQMNLSLYCNYLGDYTIDELKLSIKDLGEKWNLLGISLIQESHESYKHQNANKDIDYMALGIPLLGNYRNTTREIIEGGNGFFYDKFSASKLTYKEYAVKVENCKLNYLKYSNYQFKKTFLGVFHKVSSLTDNPLFNDH